MVEQLKTWGLKEQKRRRNRKEFGVGGTNGEKRQTTNGRTTEDTRIKRTETEKEQKGIRSRKNKRGKRTNEDPGIKITETVEEQKRVWSRKNKRGERTND